MVRIESRAGHGAGKSTEKIIEETADMRAFAAHWTTGHEGSGVIAEHEIVSAFSGLPQTLRLIAPGLACRPLRRVRQ